MENLYNLVKIMKEKNKDCFMRYIIIYILIYKY